ncbi:MAG: hypothetical protein Tsb009_31530 [Planctomycetaceae bacterium]
MTTQQSQQMLKPRSSILFGFIVLCILFRLVPYVMYQLGVSIASYPMNFSPMLPLCLFGAAYMQERKWSYAVPLIAWGIGDLAIGLLMWNWKSAFYPAQPVVYLAYVGVISLGFLLRRKRSVSMLAGTAFLSAFLFYLLSNFGVWALGGAYAHTWAGLQKCYVMALPYFRNSLLSMAVFCPVLFSRYALTAVNPQQDDARLAASIS